MEGEGWTSTEDSEEERELEIALYSQIHFEAAPEHAGTHHYQVIDYGNISFNVGVEEISLPLKGNAMEKSVSGNHFHDFLSSAKKHSKFRDKLEHANNADTIICVSSSDDDASVEIISSGTIRDDPICNRNQTDDDECIFLDISTSEINNRNRFVDEGNRETSLGKELLSSNKNRYLSTSTNKALDLIIPTSNSSKETICGQNSGEVVPIICDQSQIDDFEHNDEDDLMILDAYIQLEESLPLTESSEKPVLVPDNNTSVIEVTPNDKEKDSLLEKEHLSSAIHSEPPPTRPTTTTTEKPKESCNILPFTVTKTPVWVDKQPSSGDSDSLETEPPCTNVQDRKKVAGNKQPLKLASDKPGFLQFSENVRSFDKNIIRMKKKRLSKQEAAVIPRKPPVILRKPPVVKVSYQQDSDTNTDYSDSDISSTSTPQKVPPNRSEKRTGKSVRKESRDNVETDTSSSSSSSETENECLRSVSTSKKSCDSNSKSKLKKQKQHLKESEPSSCSDSEVEAKETMSEESDSASSVSSHPADLDKGTVHNPALDFNIEGGVESLLKSKLGKTDSEKWQIIDQDRYHIPGTTSRYFSPWSVTCRNCNKEGHIASNCPEPKKSVCIFCGRMGHVYQVCPDIICHNCNEPGHRYVDCQERNRGRHIQCDRCWMPGHFTKDCPDSWRQYHITCDSARIQTASKKHFNPKVYCFNCGKEGHLGYECESPLMNFRLIPNYPFIATYNTGEPKESRNTHHKKSKEAKRKKKKRYERDLDRNKNHGEMDYEEDYWKETVSERKNMAQSAHGSKKKGHSQNDENNKISKDSKGKKHQKNHSEKAGKHHSERSKMDKSHHSRKQIITENTVFSFQNSSYQDYQEEDSGPPRKKRFLQGNKDQRNKRHRNRSAEQSPFEDYDYNNSYQNHQEYNDMNGDDEFMNHQVFSNEWWKEGQNTQHRKRGNKKSSRKNKASKSMQNTESKKKVRNSEMYPEHQMYQDDYIKRRQKGEPYESSRKHVLPHTSQQSISTSARENYGSGEYHRPYYKSGYQRHNKKKNKSGFQMNSHFQSLSKSFQRK